MTALKQNMMKIFKHTIGSYFLAITFSLSHFTLAESNSQERPNIIFLLTDDQRADTISSYGSQISQTPHLDKLSEAGILFENAFVTDPTCKPSRVSFLTGQYERVHRVGFSSKESLDEKQWADTYPSMMRKSGYYTGFIGKFGVENYSFKGNADQKFDFWYAHDGWGKFWATHKARPHLDIYKDTSAKIVTEIMTDGVKKFFHQRDQLKPFCLSVSYSAPHGSITSTMHGSTKMTSPANMHPHLKAHPIYGELYRDLDIKIPQTYTENSADYLPLAIHDPYKGRHITYNYDFSGERSLLEHKVRYAQLVRGIDHSVGQIIEMLKKEGLSENTIILFSSDHGLLLGDYGLGGKGLLYDLTTRVPLVVYDPRLAKTDRGQRIGEQVRSVDVAPTILAMAGIEAPQCMDGDNLIPLMTDRNVRSNWDKEVFLENLYIGRDGPYSEAIRKKGWKYIRYFRPSQRGEVASYKTIPDFENIAPAYEQLFDLKNDPGETKNLIKAPEYQSILAGLRKSCIQRSRDLTQRSKAVNPPRK